MYIFYSSTHKQKVKGEAWKSKHNRSQDKTRVKMKQKSRYKKHSPVIAVNFLKAKEGKKGSQTHTVEEPSTVKKVEPRRAMVCMVGYSTVKSQVELWSTYLP